MIFSGTCAHFSFYKTPLFKVAGPVYTATSDLWVFPLIHIFKSPRYWQRLSFLPFQYVKTPLSLSLSFSSFVVSWLLMRVYTFSCLFDRFGGCRIVVVVRCALGTTIVGSRTEQWPQLPSIEILYSLSLSWVISSSRQLPVELWVWQDTKADLGLEDVGLTYELISVQRLPDGFPEVG